MPNIMVDGQLVRVKNDYIQKLKDKEEKAVDLLEKVEKVDLTDPDMWTVAKLRSALKESDIDFRPGDNKAQLLANLLEHGGIL